jgi:hypothetical protein
MRFRVAIRSAEILCFYEIFVLEVIFTTLSSCLLIHINNGYLTF